MKATVRKIVVGLCLIGGMGLLVLATLGMGRLGWQQEEKTQTPIEIPPSVVSVKDLELDTVDITDSYAGIIVPLERFSLGFEIGGRVVALGVNQVDKPLEGQEASPLDDGDRIVAGQMLAKLDQRSLQATLDEINAQIAETTARQVEATHRFEGAEDDWERIQAVAEANADAVTDSEVENTQTAVEVAQAQLDVVAAQFDRFDALLDKAEKALDDAVLTSPVSGVIARRHVNQGESISAHQPAFEVLQVDQVYLIVGVPEAYVSDIHPDQPVEVEMLARNRFRQKRQPHKGVVHRISEAADETTGLFGVEVLLDNSDGTLRPGLIGRAHIVVDKIEGFRIPQLAAVSRGDSTLVFSVDESDIAHAVPLEDWVEQDDDLIVEVLAPEHRTIVVRGQHRLVDGRPVQRLDQDEDPGPTP
jgi:RND family efflux transporter MFP subunit